MPNELSVSYNNYLNKYLAVHSLDLSGKIVGRTSPTPGGHGVSQQLYFKLKLDEGKGIAISGFNLCWERTSIFFNEKRQNNLLNIY